MENRRSKTPQMRCKKHPKHRQSTGVCSICLKERLSQLSSFKKAAKRAPSTSSSLSSLSSLGSSSNASSCASPVRKIMGKSEEKKYFSFVKVDGKNIVLTKSRSMEFYPQRSDQDKMINDDVGKKKGGFWSKLIGLRSSKKMNHEGLMHSKTTRERL